MQYLYKLFKIVQNYFSLHFGLSYLKKINIYIIFFIMDIPDLKLKACVWEKNTTLIIIYDYILVST